MRFWTREIAGWLSLALGLFGFYICFVFIVSRAILETIPATFISIFLFRGGIHLLKVATAARICLEAQARATEGRGATQAPAATTTLSSRTAVRPSAAPRPAPLPRRA